MLSFLPGSVRGLIGFVLFALNLVFWCIPFYLVAILKLLSPLPAMRRRLGLLLEALAEVWIDCNSLVERLLHRMEWDVQGVDELRRRDWYLVGSNHQTWTDIFVLQKVFNRRIPFLKFFLKKQLIWVPLLGLAWWALDLPFMQRYSRATLEKHPELRGRDLETTRKACEHFRHNPTSVINFMEGTRYTPEKHAAQASPYRHLLKPKAGGVAFVLSAMGEMMHKLLDVTIVYPAPGPSFWDLLCGRIRKVVVRVDQRKIPDEFIGGDYLNDADFRERFQAWVRDLWHAKDQRIDELTPLARSAGA